MNPTYEPRPTIEHQSDGRNLILFNGAVIGEFILRGDESRETEFGPVRRIDAVVQPILFGDSFDEGRMLDVSIASRSARRFNTEAEYDTWINEDQEPGR